MSVYSVRGVFIKLGFLVKCQYVVIFLPYCQVKSLIIIQFIVKMYLINQ